MWNKRLAMAVTVAVATTTLLCGCGSKSNTSKKEVLLYTKDVEQNKKETYETTTVTKRDFNDYSIENAELYYTNQYSVQMNVGNATLDEIKIDVGDHVKKGDVVATYTVEVDKAEMERTKLELKSQRSTFEAGVKSRKVQLANQRRDVKAMKAGTDKEIKKIELKKAEKEYKQFLSSEKELKDSEKAYREQLADAKKTKLLAKKSGVVTSVTEIAEGEPIDVGVEIAKLRQADDFVIASEDTDNGMRYNMQVDVLLGGDRDDIRYTLKGRVMSAGNITGVEDTVSEDGEEAKEVTFIHISEADKKKYDFHHNNIYVKYQKRSVKNALVVSSGAIVAETEGDNQKNFVEVVEDGSVHKRYVVVEFDTGQESVIQQGLEEGQKLKMQR